MSDEHVTNENLEDLFQNKYGKAIEKIIGSRPIVTKDFYPGNGDQYTIYTSPQQNSYVVDKYNKAWKVVAKFNISQLPGCCGVVVFHHCEVMAEFQRKGLGSLLHELRLDIAKLNKYGMAVCTTLDTNKIEEKILKKYDWIADGFFVNPKTKNKVQHWYKRLYV